MDVGKGGMEEECNELNVPNQSTPSKNWSNVLGNLSTGVRRYIVKQGNDSENQATSSNKNPTAHRHNSSKMNESCSPKSTFTKNIKKGLEGKEQK
jgi:hypothetical protein